MHKNCRFITACKTHWWVTHIKQQKLFRHLQGRGYNTLYVLYPLPWRWWNIFCCFICVTHRWVLQAVIKRQFLYVYICSFSTSIRWWDINTTGFEKKQTHWNSTSSFYCGLVSTLTPQVVWKEFVWVPMFCVYLSSGGRSVPKYVRFRVWWRHIHSRRPKSICKTNFLETLQSAAETGIWKQTAAILKLCFWFQFWSSHRHRYLNLRRRTKFRPNWTIGDEVMTS